LTPPPVNDLLALRPMPHVAAALRERARRILERWTEAVERYVPDADPLTVKQVRNSIPTVLEKIALALESDRPEATGVLEEVGTAHGVARFQEHYNIDEVLVEYRLLRRIIFDELQTGVGATLSFSDAIAVDMGVDTALHRGVMSFVSHLTERLKSATETESKYLSFLSHDLRNKLNGVTLTLEWLSQRLSDAPDFREEAGDLASLRNSVSETIEGMDRLLQAERLRKQAVELKLGPVNLHHLAGDLVAQFARQAAGKGLRLENDVPAGAAAYSDRELITLVLQNLLGNAIKYSSRGTVRIRATNDSMGWCIAITDEGPGIAPDRLGALFDAFSRGETYGQQGMGLGLTIASHAARLLGSDLQVDSTVGRGSTFSLTLPPAQPEEAR
jgi:signal transduction histidine kinase